MAGICDFKTLAIRVSKLKNASATKAEVTTTFVIKYLAFWVLKMVPINIDSPITIIQLMTNNDSSSIGLTPHKKAKLPKITKARIILVTSTLGFGFLSGKLILDALLHQ